jgi:hypothetical protein
MTIKYQDLTGQTFGDLTAVRRIGSDDAGNSIWEWRCVCGNLPKIKSHPVKRGHNLSCGCRLKRVSHNFKLENAWSEDRTARCANCKDTKSHKDFNKTYRGKPRTAFPRAWCAECDRKAHTNRYRSTPEKKLAWAFRTITSKCRIQNIPFNLEFQDFLPIPTTCPALGTPMNYDNGRDSQPTFDRLKPELGYVKGNVVLISHRANRMKGDATWTELESLTNWVKLTTCQSSDIISE